MPSTRYQKIMPITIAIYGSLVIFMVNISYTIPLTSTLFFPRNRLTYFCRDNIDRGPESLDVLRLLNQPGLRRLKATTKRWRLRHSKLAWQYVACQRW